MLCRVSNFESGFDLSNAEQDFLMSLFIIRYFTKCFTLSLVASSGSCEVNSVADIRNQRPTWRNYTYS